MARIYDNIETKFTEGLQGIISNMGVKQVYFFVWAIFINQLKSQ